MRISKFVVAMSLATATGVNGADGPRFIGFNGPSGGDQYLSQVPPAPGVVDERGYPDTGSLQPLPSPSYPTDDYRYPTDDNRALESYPPTDGYITPLPYAEDLSVYRNVIYRAERNIHPCAVPMIVQVPDPCAKSASCCAPVCVNVKVCVPPCDEPEVKCRRHGNKMILDFGKYKVDITSVRGKIIVRYHD